MLRKKSPSFIKEFAELYKPKSMLLKQQRPRLFSKNQFTILHTKVFSQRKLAILSVFFSNLAVQQTALMKSSMLCSTQQALLWLEALAAHLLSEYFKRDILQLRFNLDMR